MSGESRVGGGDIFKNANNFRDDTEEDSKTKSYSKEQILKIWESVSEQNKALE